MDCKTTKDVIEKMHNQNTYKNIGEKELEKSLRHISACVKCQIWFKNNMCKTINNCVNEDIIIFHSMVHEVICTNCDYFK